MIDSPQTDDEDSALARARRVATLMHTLRFVTCGPDPDADGPRYKAIGNSMAVNVMRWIGRRIEMVDAIGDGELPQ